MANIPPAMPVHDWTTLDLRPHQVAAVAICESYCAAFDGHSALIHHPTGSGKTGIMAVMAAMRAGEGPILVLCPSDALAAQLIAAFREEFWKTIKADAEWYLPHTERLYPSNAAKLLDMIDSDTATRRHVLVGTVQALQQIHLRPVYSQLVDRFSLVMFDEGHREPAPRWAAAVRGLRAPTILFSATPYRNDYKLFKIDDTFVSFLSFKKSCTAGIIRPIEVVEESLPDSPLEFAQRVVNFRDDYCARGLLDPGDKVIVRAATEQGVYDLYEAFVRVLAGRSERVLAVHEQFVYDEQDGNLRAKQVPKSLRNRSEIFLCHQFKLTEGIDDPACRLLVLYSPFSNERQLIQQVGRLTRHPGPFGEVAHPAFVLAREGDLVGDVWSRFLTYDQGCIDNNNMPPIRGPELIQNLLDAMPEMEYIAGKFRVRADFNDADLETDMIVPLSAIVFECKPDFDFAAFEQAIDDALIEEDREQAFAGRLDGQDCFYRLSLRLVQSPFLSTALFQSPSLEVTIATKIGERVFFYDSAGLSIDEHPALDSRLSPKAIASLLPEDNKNVITSLTLKNTDLSPLAIRQRSMRSRSLDRAGIFMGEQSHIAMNATGYKGETRRALNLARARVRQTEGVFFSIVEFHDWCEDVAAELNSGAEPARMFSRFAAVIPPPPDPIPRNILLDLWDFERQFVDENGHEITFDFEGVCVDVLPAEKGPAGFPYMFKLSTTTNSIDVFLKYDIEKRKFWVQSRELSKIKDRRNEKKSLAARINQRQPFRIIITTNVVFAYGNFYAVNLDLSRPDGPGATVLGLLTPLAGLEKSKSEKGNGQNFGFTGTQASWPSDSAFGLIDTELSLNNTVPRMARPFAGLVCEDLGSEVADFIAFDDGAPGRAVFISAKWSDGVPGAGASGLYDVIAQTLKNLGYLKSDGLQLPGKPRKFDQDWSLNGIQIARRRYGPPSQTFRRKFLETRVRPSTRRETWLVLAGGILSKKSVKHEFAMEHPQPHVLQLFHLLLSLYTTCQAVGVEPRVFCAP